jgi:hypothetical protein
MTCMTTCMTTQTLEQQTLELGSLLRLDVFALLALLSQSCQPQCSKTKNRKPMLVLMSWLIRAHCTWKPTATQRSRDAVPRLALPRWGDSWGDWYRWAPWSSCVALSSRSGSHGIATNANVFVGNAEGGSMLHVQSILPVEPKPPENNVDRCPQAVPGKYDP